MRILALGVTTLTDGQLTCLMSVNTFQAKRFIPTIIHWILFDPLLAESTLYVTELENKAVCYSMLKARHLYHLCLDETYSPGLQHDLNECFSQLTRYHEEANHQAMSEMINNNLPDLPGKIDQPTSYPLFVRPLDRNPIESAASDINNLCHATAHLSFQTRFFKPAATRPWFRSKAGDSMRRLGRIFSYFQCCPQDDTTLACLTTFKCS